MYLVDITLYCHISGSFSMYLVDITLYCHISGSFSMYLTSWYDLMLVVVCHTPNCGLLA